MNDAYILSLVAVIGVLGLLVIVFIMHRSQREAVRANAQTQATMDARVKHLEDSFPVTRQRMSEAVRDGIAPLNQRLNDTDDAIAQILDRVSSIANKVGA